MALIAEKRQEGGEKCEQEITSSPDNELEFNKRLRLASLRIRINSLLLSVESLAQHRHNRHSVFKEKVPFYVMSFEMCES